MKKIFLFIILSYLVSWVIWLPLYVPGLEVYQVKFHHGLGGFGPLIAGILVGGKTVARKLFSLRGWIYIIIALITPFLLGFVGAYLHSLFSGNTAFHNPDLVTSKEFPAFTFIQLFIYNILFFGYGEETGWRGFLLPAFQKYLSALWSSLLLTIIWAVWHWPLFLYRPGYVGMDAAGITGWFFSLLTGSILLTWLFNSTRGGLVACAVFHSTIDIVFTAEESATYAGWIGALITIWGIATVIIFKPANLSPEAKTMD